MNRLNRAVTIAIETLGCKLNQAESEALARRFLEAGCRLAADGETADVYILNTCTVTGIADRKCRSMVRQARRKSPGGLVVAAGCYAEREATTLKGLGVDIVVGNEDKDRLPEILEDSGKLKVSEKQIVDTPSGLRSRAFLKVQDGCDAFCAYCIVPFVRPNKSCLPAGEVVAQVEKRVSEGYKEVLLTGTEIGGWRDGDLELADLLERMLGETDIERLRLSSLQPQELGRRLIELWQNPRLCRHFHLSLQSGSDRILKRMKRRYAKDDYRRAVSLIRSVVPDAALTTDVIVGFPGETEEEFEESLEFCKEIGFARMHIFSYSPRPGTAASVMPSQVGDKVKKERSKEMLKLARESAAAFGRKFLGQTTPVLWEQKNDSVWSGLTDNYIRVYIKSEEDLTNRITEVRLERLYKDGVMGELTSELRGVENGKLDFNSGRRISRNCTWSCVE